MKNLICGAYELGHQVGGFVAVAVVVIGVYLIVKFFKRRKKKPE